MLIFIFSPHTIEHRNDMTEDQLILIWIVTVAILHYEMHVFHQLSGVKGCPSYLIEDPVKCPTVVLSVSHSLFVSLWLSPWLRQRGCVKTEPELNRPNLRRRMGTYVAKPEPGKHKAKPAEKMGKCRLKWVTLLENLKATIEPSSMSFSEDGSHWGEKGAHWTWASNRL